MQSPITTISTPIITAQKPLPLLNIQVSPIEKRPAVLTIENLQVHYEHHMGCENVSFVVYQGERVAVIGPNGAGKSTLFKAIVHLQKSYTGTIAIMGEVKRRHSAIGYVPQHEAVDWQFPANVWDVVMMARIRHIGYFLPPRRRDRLQIQEALEKVGLWELRHRQIGQLSGGQRRRVFIARALAQEAKIILMDEPFAGIDVAAEEEILAVLDVLKAQAITVLVATHNLGQAQTHYDKVLMINRQQIAYGEPECTFTAENLMRTFGGHVTFWQNGMPWIAVDDGQCHDHDHDNHD